MTINVHKTMKDYIEFYYSDRNIFQVSQSGSRILEQKLKKLINEITKVCCEDLQEGRRILPQKIRRVLDSRTTMSNIWDIVLREENV